MTYKIEITNEESVFLYYALSLADNTIHGIKYNSRFDTTTGDISLEEAIDYISLIVGTRDKMIADAAGRDKDKAMRLLESLYQKITSVMNTEKYSR